MTPCSRISSLLSRRINPSPRPLLLARVPFREPRGLTRAVVRPALAPAEAVLLQRPVSHLFGFSAHRVPPNVSCVGGAATEFGRDPSPRMARQRHHRVAGRERVGTGWSGLSTHRRNTADNNSHQQTAGEQAGAGARVRHGLVWLNARRWPSDHAGGASRWTSGSLQS